MHEPEPLPPMDGVGFDALAAMPAVAQARFTCVRHGTEAGSVGLHGDDAAGWMVVVDSFVCRQHERIHTGRAQELEDALKDTDVHRVYRLDPEWAPFYCPGCARVYCGECWRTELVFDPEWKDWVEETRGVCPEGHERMLSD